MALRTGVLASKSDWPEPLGQLRTPLRGLDDVDNTPRLLSTSKYVKTTRRCPVYSVRRLGSIDPYGIITPMFLWEAGWGGVRPKAGIIGFLGGWWFIRPVHSPPKK